MRKLFRSTLLILAIILLAACGTPAPAPSASVPTAINQSATAAAPQRLNPPLLERPTAVPATAANAPSTATAVPKRPNIVLILADDLDAYEFQFMPKLKSLISDQGVTLTNYFVAMSLCCPSRATTLRGQYPHNTQILGNGLPTGGFQKFFQLGEEKSTIATWLQDAGYRTMLAGKYLNDFPQKSNLMYIPPGWTEWYSAVSGNSYGEYNYALNENGKRVAYGNKPVASR